MQLRGRRPHERDRDEELQEELWEWLRSQKIWNEWSRKRHVAVAHHPHSLEHILSNLRVASIVVADFWRPSFSASSATRFPKDIVSPYRTFLEPFNNDYLGWYGRSTLLFFRGGTKRKRRGKIREQLVEMLNGESDVICEEADSRQEGAVKDSEKGMRQSKFCLSPVGDTPSSCRLFDAIVSHCVPVIISDRLELPYEDILDYSRFVLFIGERKSLEKGFLLSLLRNVTQKQWESRWRRLKEVKKHFIYNVPAEEGGAEDMVWQALSRRVQGIRFSDIYRKKRRMYQKGKLMQLL